MIETLRGDSGVRLGNRMHAGPQFARDPSPDRAWEPVTLYALKPRFQDLLRPLAALLPRIGVTANLVTIVAALGSVLAGAVTAFLADSRPVFLIIPAWLLARMALNAIDGMLAREFHQKSVLGG